jgi:Rhamnan synthesis protein F
MSLTAAIYVIQDTHLDAGHPGHALDRLRAEVDHLIVVGASSEVAAASRADQIIAFRRAVRSTLSGYKIGLEALYQIGADWRHVILTGSHVFGPFGDHAALPDTLAASGAALFAPYWHDLTLDKDEPRSGAPGRIPYLDYTILGPDILSRPDFREFWSAFRPSDQPEREFRDGLVGFARYCRDAGLDICYPVAEIVFETADPRHFEIHKVVAAGGPVLPLSVFFLDPILHDANAIYLRRALEDLRVQDPVLYDLVTGYVVTHMKARDFCMISDQYAVLAGQPDNLGKTAWNFGRIAIFIHAYYANMMPEFWVLIQKVPCEVDLFITTSSPEDKAHIEAFLADQSWPADRADVRVVEVNRGRDMSSLFISFRDVIMAERYDVALRLHSKRTPQVSRQVGESFKDHLFENLADTPDYVRNLLDMMEAEPDIGLVIPPVIHIGFGTLGHSWFNNRKPLKDLAYKMGLKVPLDDHMPVTAYGTMYWFRTEALRAMFEWNWKWEDYNPEPNHIDGGLAHVQERLIGYVVQDKGYRTVSVMTQAMAGRYYAKLEYKMQLMASYLASGNIYLQRQQLETMADQRRMRLYRGLQNSYGAMLRRFPGSRRFLQPLARHVQSLIAPGKMR